ncbi:MAG: hypothetical protein HFJ99_08345 [Eubacterium sp.]|nr:hypothetical protein [Eubacterium sp.]
MKLKYFTESAYNDLFDCVDKNVAYYSDIDNNWIKKKFDKREYSKESRIDVTLPPLSISNSEYMNAVKIHTVFKDRITPKQASNPYLWSYLSHCEYWEYTCQRWSSTRMSVDSIKEHYFCKSETGNRIGFLRNSISRLWWMAELSYQEDKSNRYELTELLFSHSDLCQSVIERNFSMNKEVIVGILSAIKAINDDPDLKNVGIDKNGEYEWRNLCKYINRYGAVTLLDVLDRDDIREISYKYILEQRKEGD